MNEQIERICISVNTRCNLACEYCYFFNPENRINSEKDLSVTDLMIILNNINEYAKLPDIEKKIKINFVGSGEPLLSWKNIKESVSKFNEIKNHNIKFYTVTNATLITDIIAKEMKELHIFPSVSLDGYKELNDKYRKDAHKHGSFEQTINGIKILRNNSFDIAINTVATKTLSNNLERFFLFLNENDIKKVIFDRIVDTPSNFDDLLSYDEYYYFLNDVASTIQRLGLQNRIEVGNLEAYNRAIKEKPDKVCTMFGSSCGAGTNFIIYIGKEVYPCGRMFGQSNWLIGDYQDKITDIQKQMLKKINNREDWNNCEIINMCFRDCLIERNEKTYSCKARYDFINNYKKNEI